MTTALKALMILTLPLVSSLAMAQSSAGGLYNSYKLQFTNDENYTFKGDLYTIASHVDDGWDTGKASFAGTRRLIDFSKSKVITRFGFVSHYGGGKQEFTQDDMTFIADSAAGSHRFAFTQAKGFYIAGGNLTLCLCEVLRDLIHGTEGSTVATQNFVLVSDAVYDDESYYPSRLGSAESSPKFNLAQLERASGATDEVLADYIHQRVIGKYGVFCAGQNYYRHADIDPADYTFEVYRGTKLISKVGTKGRLIRLILAPTQDLETVSQAFGLDKHYPMNNPF